MKFMKPKILLIVIVTLYIVSPLRSQVTIGSGIEPRKGSLLELKENDEAGKNSTKGFSLPRVKLESLTKLTVDDDSKGMEYKGLTVQNTYTTDGFTEGIYCWDGYKWTLVVSVKEQGKDGQMLISKGAGKAPEWKSQQELNIPTVDFIANTITTGSTYVPADFRTVKLDSIYMKDFEYNKADGNFTPKKSAYYQVYIYNTIDVKPPETGESGDNGGTATTALAKRINENKYEGILSLNAYYYKGSTYVCHPVAGLVYFEQGQQYAIRTSYTRKFRVNTGRIAFVYLRD